MICGLALSAPVAAFAAEATPTTATAPAGVPAATSDVEELVVVGSRIKRSVYNSPSPVQVITSERVTLEGLVSTSDILQTSTLASNAQQVDNQFTGFVTAGGPGVNTLSLRGLGPQRTLILLNGRRISPAGTRGQVGAVDLNTLPSSIVERFEILKDGASSVYGSDAVAGVVNIITKSNLNGGEINVAGTIPEKGGGGQYRVSGSWGKTFDHGFLNISGEYSEQRRLTIGQRDYLSCPQDLYRDPATGASLDLIDPATGQSKCFNTLNSTYTRASDAARYFYDPIAVQNGNASPTLAWDQNGFRRFNGTYSQLIPSNVVTRGGYNAAFFPTTCPTTVGDADLTDPACIAARIAFARNSQAIAKTNDPRQQNTTAISPAKRGSIFFTAGYDLSPGIQLYTEALFNRRQSSQTGWGQIFNNVRAGFSAANPTGHPFNQFPFTSRTTILIPRNGSQQDDYYKVVVGLKGKLPAIPLLSGWDWDVYAQRGHSTATYTNDITFQDAVNSVINLTGTPANPICDQSQIIRAGVTCRPVNWYDPAVVNSGIFAPADAAFLFGQDVGHTLYVQDIVEGSITGDLFNLPAGPLGVAAGIQYRRDHIDDIPGAATIAGNNSGQTSAGRTVGTDHVLEEYGELSIPVLKGLPLVRSLDVSLSGRHSDYASYGSNNTWKVGVNWQITPWLRIRGTEGTSFRAPALYELFLQNQTGFLAQTTVDPCIGYGASTNPILQANCATLNLPGGGLFPGAAGSATIITGGGAGVLKPETSRAKTLGFVFTPSFVDFSVAVDYSEIDVRNGVGTLTAGSIATTCYTSPIFPAEPLCALIKRGADPLKATFNGIDSINSSYININRQTFRSIDLNATLRHDFDFVRAEMDFEGTWALEQRRQTIGSAVRDFNGEVTNPDFVAQVSWRLDRGEWTAFWSTDIAGKQSDTEPLGTDTVVISARSPAAGRVGAVSVYRKQYTQLQVYHALSVRRVVRDWTFQVGVRNLFGARPPTYSNTGFESRIGTVVFDQSTDIVGRRFTVSVSKRF